MFKVGQKVWCAMLGEGEVTKICTHNTHFPVAVSFGGAAPELYTLDGRFYRNANPSLFPHPVEIVKKVTKPSINWDHVHSRYNYLAEDSDGGVFLYRDEPYVDINATFWRSQGDELMEVRGFATFVEGTCHWKESLVKRPEGDNHDD